MFYDQFRSNIHVTIHIYFISELPGAGCNVPHMSTSLYDARLVLDTAITVSEAVIKFQHFTRIRINHS